MTTTARQQTNSQRKLCKATIEKLCRIILITIGPMVTVRMALSLPKSVRALRVADSVFRFKFLRSTRVG
jgi:hypothetical protein